MTPEEEFTHTLSRHLDGIRSEFERELREVLASTFPPGTAFLVIEYDSPHFDEDFGVGLWAMDKTGNYMGNGDGYWFLERKATAVPPALYQDERFEDFNPWAMASHIVEDWVVDSWARVGSRQFPAYIGHHDSHFIRDLTTGFQTAWSQIARR